MGADLPCQASNTFQMGILEKIAEVEKEINRTQKNKGTIDHISASHYMGNSDGIPFGYAQGQTRQVSPRAA